MHFFGLDASLNFVLVMRADAYHAKNMIRFSKQISSIYVHDI